MRVAALYDLHGNLPALEAALADAERASPDLILFGGDLVSGPFPAETLALVRSFGARARSIRGNADRKLDVWTAGQLNAEQRTWLYRLPERAVVRVEGVGEILFCHGSPRSDTEVVTARTPVERLRPMLASVEQGVVVCGHTHMQFDRFVDETRVVNAGSVGMPYGEGGAHWLLIGPGFELRRTPYDRAGAARRIRTSGWPQAEEFAAENVLNVPAAEEALDFFESQPRGR